MHVNFDSQNPEARDFCALVNESGRRIEFHVICVEGETYMIALSGKYGQPATRQKAVGPFLSVAKAERSVRSICNALVRTGYEELVRSKPHWQFQVLGETRKLRSTPPGHSVSYLSDFYSD